MITKLQLDQLEDAIIFAECEPQTEVEINIHFAREILSYLREDLELRTIEQMIIDRGGVIE